MIGLKPRIATVRGVIHNVYTSMNQKFTQLTIEQGALHYSEHLQDLAAARDRLDQILQDIPSVPVGETPEEVERLSQFEDWFHDKLFDTQSCLERDVLRDAKTALRDSWMHRKPQG